MALGGRRTGVGLFLRASETVEPGCVLHTSAWPKGKCQEGERPMPKRAAYLQHTHFLPSFYDRDSQVPQPCGTSKPLQGHTRVLQVPGRHSDTIFGGLLPGRPGPPTLELPKPSQHTLAFPQFSGQTLFQGGEWQTAGHCRPPQPWASSVGQEEGSHKQVTGTASGTSTTLAKFIPGKSNLSFTL